VSSGTALPTLGIRPRVASWPARTDVLEPSLLAVGALTIFAGVLRFARLGHQGFWFDEGNTALLVHFSAGKMLGLLPQSESTPPLYYGVAWVWARLFGFGEAGLRSLSAFAGAATVPVAFAAAWRLLSRRAGLIAAALTACNPLLIWYSQEARSYSLLVLLSGLGLLAFAHARTNPTRRNLTWWAVAAVAAVATHYYAVLAIAPEAVLLLAAHPRRRDLQLAIATVMATGLALIPLAISQSHTGHTSWITRMRLHGRLGQIVPQFLLGFQSPIREVLYAIAGACVLLALTLLVLRAGPREQRAALAVGSIAASGLFLSLLIVFAGTDDLLTRNVVALWLPAALLIVAGLGTRRARIMGMAAACALCATGVIAAVGVAADRSLQRPDWRAVAQLLGPVPRPGSPPRAVFIQHYRDLLPLSLYLRNLRAWPRGDAVARVREIDVIAIKAPRVHLCWWGAACNLSPTRLQSSYPIHGFHELWRRRALQFTVLRLVSSRPTPLTRSAVSAALRATTFRKDELLMQSPSSP
jgi:mannosyltransferase